MQTRSPNHSRGGGNFYFMHICLPVKLFSKSIKILIFRLMIYSQLSLNGHLYKTDAFGRSRKYVFSRIYYIETVSDGHLYKRDSFFGPPRCTCQRVDCISYTARKISRKTEK